MIVCLVSPQGMPSVKDGLQRNWAATAAAESGFSIRQRSTLFAATLALRLFFLALWSVSGMLLAQGATNSGTLSVALDGHGTNLVINYSMTTTQGWVPLFPASRADQLAASAQPVDIAPVAPSMQSHFTVPINPAAPAQFYRL